MADSLTPWLFDYLLNIAETYGAQISNVPLYDRKKKVQIMEFLTFGSEEQDTYIWARVSDKKHIVPIKFTKEAVAEFKRISSRRLTQHKGGIVTIKQFKCISSRLPLDGGKPSAHSYLALECDGVSLLGSSGESTFGNPKPITAHADMQLWSQALNQDGGAGNVLKERKEQRDREAEQANAAFSERQPSMPPPPPPISRPQANEMTIPLTRTKVTDLASYHARWQIVEKSNLYRHPPEEDEADGVEAVLPVAAPASPVREKVHSQAALQVGASASPVREQTPSEESAQSDSSRSRSGTPIASWAPSSPAKPVSSPLPENKRPSIGDTNKTSSSLARATPSQQKKQPTQATIASEDPSSSYPAAVNESVLDIVVDAEDADGAPIRQPVPRKVPRPTSPQPRRNTGPALVLVPNSDTSGTQSQSLSLTQPSQSVSQSRPQAQESDEEVGSSSPNNAVQRPDEEVEHEEIGEEESDDNDMSMEVDHEAEEEEAERHRRSRTLSPEAASNSGVSSSPEKSVDGDGRRYADSNESDGGSGASNVDRGSEESEERDGSEMDESSDDDEGADSSDDGYPWMTMSSVRRVIVQADALRRLT